jgi:hypothetical protein
MLKLTDGMPPDDRTAIERVLGRRVTTQPPNLQDWIEKYGGYAGITERGWAEYDAEMRRWNAERGA